jgi:cystathionine beta-lyase
MSSVFDVAFERRGSNSIKWDTFAEDVIPMSIADMDFPSPPPVIDALRKRLEFPTFAYERSHRGFIESASGWLRRVYGLDVPREWIVLTDGTIPSLSALCGLTDKFAVTHTPNYTLHYSESEHFAAKILYLQMDETPFAGGTLEFSIDFDDFERRSRGAGLYYFTNPHNPIGKVYGRSELEEIAGVAERNGFIVLSDEIHCEIVYGKRHIPFFEVSPGNSITLFAAGKIANLTGLPHAFAVIPDAPLRKRAERALFGSGYPGALEALAASVAFSGECDEWKRELVAYLAANRDYLASELRRRLPKAALTRADGTFLQYIDFSAYIDPDAEKYILNNAKVALTGAYRFGARDKRSARLNFACPRSRLETATGRIADALAAPA